MGRDIERIIIVLTAGLSIYLGYRLFHIATKTQGELSAKFDKKYNITLKDLAPGIYFPYSVRLF